MIKNVQGAKNLIINQVNIVVSSRPMVLNHSKQAPRCRLHIDKRRTLLLSLKRHVETHSTSAKFSCKTSPLKLPWVRSSTSLASTNTRPPRSPMAQASDGLIDERNLQMVQDTTQGKDGKEYIERCALFTSSNVGACRFFPFHVPFISNHMITCRFPSTGLSRPADHHDTQLDMP